MDTSFKVPSFVFKPVTQANQKPPVVQNNQVQNQTEVKNTPTESFTFSTPLKVAREGSDMAQMVDDLQNNGVIPQSQAETVAPKAEEKKLREPANDYMAQMVDSIKTDAMAGADSLHVQVNSNGTISLLDDSAYFALPGHNAKEAAEEFKHQYSHLPGLQHASEKEGHAVSTQGHGHHDKGFKEDGLLGGHMGTEVVEKLGHSAHHAVEVSSEGVGHVTTEAAGHGSAKIATEAASHGTAKVAAEGASHGAAKAGAHGTELMAHGAETATETADATAAGLKTVANNAHHLSAGLEIALGVGTVGAGLLAVPLTYNGVKELKHGIKEKDTEKILEGVGGIAVGTRSAATAAVMGGMLTTSEVVGQVAHVASATLTPLGLVHAGVDTVLGVRDLTKGKTTEGLLKIGTGAAIGAAAVIGGLPLTLTALAMLGAKVGHKIYTKVQDKKKARVAEEEAVKQQQQQQPQANAGLTGSQTVPPTSHATGVKT